MIRTNRDLYLFVADLEADRTLEDYLTALWHLSSVERERAVLPFSRFAALLEEALRATAPSFDRAWSQNYGRDQGLDGFAGWEQTILDQIVDLHEMNEAGTLANELRYFGIDAPRGARWYNFEPLAFLEGAVAGTFGGWREGDQTGRNYVPGPVAVFDKTGQLTSADPRDLDAPTVEVPAISWDTFAEFLAAGQWYE